MNKLFYPAIFHKAEEGGFWVEFSELPECLTQGKDMEEAYEMAVEALGLSLTTREEKEQKVPQAFAPVRISMEEGFLVVVEFDMAEYRKRNCTKAVK